VTAQSTTDKIVDLIEKDYLSLLKGMIELKNEIRSTSDRNVLEELKFAKSMLINDYTNGAFAIFESNAVCQTGFIKSSNRYSEDRIDAFLLNYAGKNFQNVFLDVERVQKSKHNNSWYEVSYVSQGEVSGTITQRIAIVSVVNNSLKIRKLSYSGAPHDHNDIAQNSIQQKQIVSPIAEEIIKPKVKKKEEPMPSISITSIELISPEFIKVDGKIIHPKSQGTLSAMAVENNLTTVSYNESENIFTLDIPVNNRLSQEINLKYSYGSKFIQLRKNIVLFNPPMSAENESEYSKSMPVALTSQD
jgi:hypothetical protein